jgi:hypothetical protein
MTVGLKGGASFKPVAFVSSRGLAAGAQVLEQVRLAQDGREGHPVPR